MRYTVDAINVMFTELVATQVFFFFGRAAMFVMLS